MGVTVFVHRAGRVYLYWILVDAEIVYHGIEYTEQAAFAAAREVVNAHVQM